MLALLYCAHVFDLAQHMPDHLSIVFVMAWFGDATADPQSGGADPGWGNWKANFPACGLANDPTTCADFPGAGLQRSIASKRRPLAGIYSSSGRTDESRQRIDLMLSTARRSCDAGARIDSFGIQLDSIKFTSRYPNNQQSPTWDLAYRALIAFFERADGAGLRGAVTVSSDATVYWHFGDSFGLTTQDQRKQALQDDITDMATIAAMHPSALSIAGRPLLMFYVDAALMTPAEWTAVLEGARAASGVDFYAVATTLNGSYLQSFDALAPWVNLGIWANTSGADERTHAQNWALEEHAQIVAALPSYPGRVMFGGVAPGFDDYTQNWGACSPREIPRDPDVMAGEFDYLKQAGVRALVLETWDDWTEGTELEPDVAEGAAKLVQLRQLTGDLLGEPADPTGDAALVARWTAFGQPRNCCFAGGACPDAGTPANLTCPPPDGGVIANDGGAPDASANAAQNADGGCGCDVGGRGPTSLFAVILLLAVTRVSRPRRC